MVTGEAPWQLLPGLGDDEYISLKNDIAARGVMVPVELDEHGAILDGHHRMRACRELGITEVPVVVRRGWDDEAKVAHVLGLNLHRRHLDAAQRATLVATLRARGTSLRAIAKQIGVGLATVHRAVAGVPSGTPEAPARIVGTDGKAYLSSRPAPPPELMPAVTPPTDVTPEVAVVTPRMVRAQAEVAAERMAAIADAVPARVEAQYGLPYGRVMEHDAWEFVRGLPEGIVDACITSPPYWRKRVYGDDGEGELGQEASPESYLARMRAIIAEIGKVLTPTGWLVLNLGDTYASQPGQYRGDPERARGISDKAKAAAATAPADRDLDVPEKSQALIPWRLVTALVTEDGWRCRNVVAWHKIGHQPENVHDRLTQAWEPVFLLTRARFPYFSRDTGDFLNPVDIWGIPVGRRGEGGDHPAVFPDKLVEKAIAHMCPPGGVVLDPFAGSGTVLDVAQRMGRRFLGCDLYAWGRAGDARTLQ